MRLFWAIAAIALWARVARGDPLQHEFLVLPSAVVVGTFDRQAPVTQIVDQVVQADMLFSLQKGPFKLFGEYLVSDHEGDLERFQLGYQLSDDLVIWLGRYHQPTSVWNHDHHHGQYLQTSISRPAIDEWEDLGGVLPQHFTGVLIEGSKPVFGNWRLRAAVAAGMAPQITSDGMKPFDLLHWDADRYQMGYQARASLHPGDFTETGFGILAAHDDMAAVGLIAPGLAGFDHVHLNLLGVFGTYAGTAWKVTATLYQADARLYFTTWTVADHFEVGYVEAERHLPFDLTAFARWEASAGASSSPYLHLFDEFTRTRHVAGLRWDFVQRQAITVQVSDSHTLNGRFSDVRLQWSAAFF